MLGGGVVEVVVAGDELAGGEVVEDIGKGPGAEDLPIPADGELVRDVGEAAGGAGGGGGGAGGGKDGGGLALQSLGRGAFCGGAVAEDDGNEDAEGAEEEAENESVPPLAGACEGATDEGAENPDEENGDRVHDAAMVRETRGRRQGERVGVCEDGRERLRAVV